MGVGMEMKREILEIHDVISWATRVANEACGFVAVDKGLQLAYREFRKPTQHATTEDTLAYRVCFFFSWFLIKLQSVKTEAASEQLSNLYKLCRQTNRTRRQLYSIELIKEAWQGLPKRLEIQKKKKRKPMNPKFQIDGREKFLRNSREVQVNIN